MRKEAKKKRVLTTDDVDKATLQHYIRYHALLHPPKGIIPPIIKPYVDYRYILNPPRPYNEAKDYWGKTMDEMRLAVEQTLNAWSDIKRVGIWLSGGTDSSLLLKFASDILGSDKVRGYNFTWGDVKDESEYAKSISDYCDTRLITKEMKPEDGLKLMKESSLLMRAPSWCPQVLFVSKTCAKDGTDKCFIGLGLDALTGGEVPHARAKTEKEFQQAEHDILNTQIFFIWSNTYQCRGYCSLKMPFFQPSFVKYMRSLPTFHKTLDGDTKLRIRDEAIDYGILPQKNAQYGRVSGTKLGFGPDWVSWAFTREYQRFFAKHIPEKWLYKIFHGHNTVWWDLLLASTKLFYDCLEEGKFYA